MISIHSFFRRAAVPLATLCLVLTSRAQDSLSVDAVVTRVLAQHPLVTRAEALVRSAEARRGQTESGLLPSVGFDGAYARIGPVPSLTFPGLGNFKLYPENNYDVHVGGRYTVLDFGKVRSTVDLADAGVQSARDQVQLSKTDLAFESISSFYTILLLRRTIIVADEELSALNDHLRIVRAKVETGSATVLDSLNVAVRVAAIMVQKAELGNRLQREETHLRQLMGVGDTTELPLRGEFRTEVVPTNVDSLMVAALQRRPDVLVVRDAVKSAELQQNVARSGNLPYVQVSGMVGAKNGYIPNLDLIKANWAVAVELGIPIFDGHRTLYATEEAQAGVNASVARQMELNRRVRQEVISGLSDLRTAYEKVGISETEVSQAVAAMSIARTKFENGTATNVEVLDAQTAEATAKLHQLQALYAYVMSRFALERAVGERLYEAG